MLGHMVLAEAREEDIFKELEVVGWKALCRNHLLMVFNIL